MATHVANHKRKCIWMVSLWTTTRRGNDFVPSYVVLRLLSHECHKKLKQRLGE
ncbi:uncharacterized protein PHALS_12444 [Plasmopara halstedii]|uniref:Uncharacterized protein n=1 Tax=Plasmopara halstedii TaxID=4781 RepID=A0A0P1AMZ0_PLAHL|nr:uncharacterized protein PHALS_12444 [Plasmopara halstedii]CEG42145.1 hypothetical protein PHALS_12444 [Plasmopara halstedii]|eukprot:XP_024578514.1 hypothetical protein PHALS_12444 [Plasmopara halstedii]